MQVNRAQNGALWCLVLFLALLLLPACGAQTGSPEEGVEDSSLRVVGDSSLQFDGERYPFAWAAEAPVIAREYVRGHETVESWTQMLTFAVVEGVFEDVVNQYLDGRRPWMVLEPDILEATDSPHTHDIIIRLVLAAHDGFDAEFVLARAVADPGEPVTTLVFSKKLVSTEEAALAPVFARTDEWVAELALFSL
jgi:hypothetical protein